jgi:hypothetical protein
MYICGLDIDFTSFSSIFLLDFGTVLAVWNLFFLQFIKSKLLSITNLNSFVDLKGS